MFYQDDSGVLSPNEAEVTIHARIWDKDALGLAKVCSLKRDHGSGLGIWVSVSFGFFLGCAKADNPLTDRTGGTREARGTQETPVSDEDFGQAPKAPEHI